MKIFLEMSNLTPGWDNVVIRDNMSVSNILISAGYNQTLFFFVI